MSVDFSRWIWLAHNNLAGCGGKAIGRLGVRPWFWICVGV